jgi:hypothetical protein
MPLIKKDLGTLKAGVPLPQGIILEILGADRGKFQYWVKLGLISPKIKASGRGKASTYTGAEVFKAALVHTLDQSGFDIQSIRYFLNEEFIKFMANSFEKSTVLVGVKGWMNELIHTVMVFYKSRRGPGWSISSDDSYNLKKLRQKLAHDADGEYPIAIHILWIYQYLARIELKLLQLGYLIRKKYWTPSKPGVQYSRLSKPHLKKMLEEIALPVDDLMEVTGLPERDKKTGSQR